MGDDFFFLVGLTCYMEGLWVLVQAVTCFMCWDSWIGLLLSLCLLFIGAIRVIALYMLSFDNLANALFMPGFMMTQTLIFLRFFYFLRAAGLALPSLAKISIQLFIVLLERLDISLWVFEQLYFFFLNFLYLNFKRICINFELLFNLTYNILTPIFLRIYVSCRWRASYSFLY